jgi:hypothetical protein
MDGSDLTDTPNSFKVSRQRKNSPSLLVHVNDTVITLSLSQQRITSLPHFLFWLDVIPATESCLTTHHLLVYFSVLPAFQLPFPTLWHFESLHFWTILGNYAKQSFKSWTCHLSSPTSLPNFPFPALIFYTFISVIVASSFNPSILAGNSFGLLHNF